VYGTNPKEKRERGVWEKKGEKEVVRKGEEKVWEIWDRRMRLILLWD
jgi:hypothetical protein